MNSRNMVLEAINHKMPERIPWTLYLSAPLYEKIEQIWGTRENWPCPPNDTISPDIPNKSVQKSKDMIV